MGNHQTGALDYMAGEIEDNPTCVLLLSGPQYLAEQAQNFCSLLFSINHVSSYPRWARHLDPLVQKTIDAQPIDYLFNFLSPIIVPESILRKIRKAAINFHPAPPKWPGVGSSSYALFEGDTTFGATAHLMKKHVDSGEIIKTISFPIIQGETCDSLFERSRVYTLLLFFAVLQDIAATNKITIKKQGWSGKPRTRTNFEKWMQLSLSEDEEILRRKIEALRHRKLPGPYIEIAGHTFELSPSERNL